MFDLRKWIKVSVFDVGCFISRQLYKSHFDNKFLDFFVDCDESEMEPPLDMTSHKFDQHKCFYPQNFYIFYCRLVMALAPTFPFCTIFTEQEN